MQDCFDAVIKWFGQQLSLVSTGDYYVPYKLSIVQTVIRSASNQETHLIVSKVCRCFFSVFITLRKLIRVILSAFSVGQIGVWVLAYTATLSSGLAQIYSYRYKRSINWTDIVISWLLQDKSLDPSKKR